MNVHQTGANVAVTQLKSNNHKESQLSFFPPSLLCCSVQETGQGFKASSSLTDSGGRREKKKKKSVLLPHSHGKFIILFSVSGMTPGANDFCVQYTVTPCMSWS